MPILYLVGTPIGNLEDITLRALRILAEVDLIAAEDTRKSGKLLQRFDIKTPLLSYHEHNEQGRTEEILSKLEAADVALISDAGMPGLSDPGYRLVRAAVDAGVRVVPIPGPSAGISTLVVSGLSTESYLFLGFLPRQKKRRQEKLNGLASSPYTLILYEAPHRLLALLKDVKAVLGDRQVCIGRELTKLHEELWRGKVSAAIDHYGQGKVRGEITLVIEGADLSKVLWDETKVREALQAELSAGTGRKAAAAAVSERSGWRKKDVYNLKLNQG
jgi:16S rRNA (cytidine1402-2'-O)-methyltransferase